MLSFCFVFCFFPVFFFFSCSCFFYQENPFRDRICQVFSECGTGAMKFKDFLDMLSVFNDKSSLEVKLEYAFRIHGRSRNTRFLCVYRIIKLSHVPTLNLLYHLNQNNNPNYIVTLNSTLT